MSMSLTKSFSLSLNDCKDPGKDPGRFFPVHTSKYQRPVNNLGNLCPDTSSVDTLSVSSQPDELCARVVVRTADQTEVNTVDAVHHNIGRFYLKDDPLFLF